jgi:hypothetical protein
MVEKVARALYAIRMETAERAGLHDPYTWETDNNVYREHCLREARAAIEAMREPTAEMFMAPYDGQTLAKASTIWRRMVDAALTPPPSGEM